MFGLWIAKGPDTDEQHLRDILARQLIPLEGFVQADTFACPAGESEFLRRAILAVMLGEPIPAEGVERFLSGSVAGPGNVLRKYVLLQLSLMPLLRKNPSVVPGEGCFLLGNDLLIAPLGTEGQVDALLPDGVWTELATGECFTGRLRRMRGLNTMPILARENSVIPIGVNDRTPWADDADRVTLHWFQPGESAACALADGTSYHLSMENGRAQAQSDSQKSWHLIIHQDGLEMLIR